MMLVSAAAVRRLSGRVAASPYGRKLAREAQLPLSAVGSGSGPGGRIVAADVEAALKGGHQRSSSEASTTASSSAAAPAPAPAPAAATEVVGSGFVDVHHTPTRETIAKRLAASKQQVPHYVLSTTVTLDDLLALRTRLNAGLGADEQLTVNDFLVKASAVALRRVPDMNSSWLQDSIRAYDYADVCVSMSTPGGVMTPVVRDADAKGLSAISADVRSLSAGAQDGTLTPEHYAGGTFTITNLGAYGVRQFAAIINPPQAGILAVGAARKEVVPNDAAAAAGEDGDAELYKIETRMTVSLSCDHRVVDGAVGAQWLAEFKSLLEDPTTMLL